MTRRFPIGAGAAGFSILLLAALSYSPFGTGQAASADERGLVAAAEFYRPETVQVIRLEISAEDLARMQAALPKRVYVPASFQWGEQTLPKVGVRYKGNSSSQPKQRHKRSFLIKFDRFEKDRRFLGLRRVALDNGVQFGSLFSEPIITEILRETGVTASRANLARLYLNGKFHGVYVNVERIDTVFLKNHFDDPGGPLYKIDTGGPGGNLSPVPAQVRSRARTFEPKSKTADKQARDVHQLIAAIKETPDDRFARVMEDTLEVDKFLKTMAVMLFSGAFDQLTGWGPHNYYLYRNPRDGRWHYLPWDLDVGFADSAFGRIPVIDGWHAAWPIPGGPPRPLIERIVDDPKLLARYRRFADVILEKHFHPRVIVPKLDGLYSRVKDDLARDPFPHRRVTNPRDRSYDDVVASLKEFMRRRYQTARAQLDDPGKRPQPLRGGERGRERGRGREPGREPAPSKTATKDAPSGLRAVARTPRSVILRWQDNAEGEAGHVVQRADGENGGFRNVVGRPGPNSILAADDNVAPGRVYRYRVFAVFPTPSGPRGSSVSNAITVQVPEK